TTLFLLSFPISSILSIREFRPKAHILISSLLLLPFPLRPSVTTLALGPQSRQRCGFCSLLLPPVDLPSSFYENSGLGPIESQI
ncbi:hypothetical protein PFISCL1PPCAC_347, partial [Pristionchus fissidentatus]